MRIYKIIKQISINDFTGERKERYVVIGTYTTFIERVVAFLLLESSNPIYEVTIGGTKHLGNNVFDTLEKARECKEKLENPTTYTNKNEVVK